MTITGLFAKRAEEIITDSKVLVCSLDPRFRDAFEVDLAVYLRHYRNVNAVPCSTIEGLRGTLAGYDIVHLFCNISPDGAPVDWTHATLTGSDLINRCCKRDVKVLWIANENSADAYIKGFRAIGKPLNLVMTVCRNGMGFSKFLENLLSRISSGETLPVAWASLVPQADGPWQRDLPGCIFFAGRGGVKLLS